jgi:hypothetical protein
MTATKELSKYKLYSAEYKRSNGTEIAPNQKADTHLSLEKGMTIMK